MIVLDAILRSRGGGLVIASSQALYGSKEALEAKGPSSSTSSCEPLSVSFWKDLRELFKGGDMCRVRVISWRQKRSSMKQLIFGTYC